MPRHITAKANLATAVQGKGGAESYRRSDGACMTFLIATDPRIWGSRVWTSKERNNNGGALIVGFGSRGDGVDWSASRGVAMAKCH